MSHRHCSRECRVGHRADLEVGDAADGFPGLAGWGPKSAATVLAAFGRKEYRIDGMPPEIEKLWQQGAEWLKAAMGLLSTLGLSAIVLLTVEGWKQETISLGDCLFLFRFSHDQAPQKRPML